LLLKGKRGVVSFKALQLKTTRRSAPLAAKVAGGQLKLGTATGGKFSRAGFGAKYAIRTMTLALKVATRLDKRLHLQFPTGAATKFGTVTSDFQPESVSILEAGRASLELDPGFSAKLDRLHVAVNPIFPAEHPGPFTFAIFGGRLSPDLARGALELRGGLELLQLGGGKVVWSESRLELDTASLLPEADIEPSPPYPGKVGPVAVASLNLAAGAVSSDPKSRTISLSGAALILSAAAAATLNEVFGRPQGEESAFAGGEPLGRVSFSAQGQ
jgi:hypothetical protein